MTSACSGGRFDTGREVDEAERRLDEQEPRRSLVGFLADSRADAWTRTSDLGKRAPTPYLAEPA